nr:MAG TPA: hypothetical protein [Caudoviricetes sp.]
MLDIQWSLTMQMLEVAYLKRLSLYLIEINQCRWNRLRL